MHIHIYLCLHFSVTTVPQTSRDVNQKTAQQVLKAKSIGAHDAADEADELLAQNSSKLSRFVEGMEEQGSECCRVLLYSNLNGSRLSKCLSQNTQNKTCRVLYHRVTFSVGI